MAVKVPVHFDFVGEDRQTTMGVCLCEVETADGLVGYGFTGITDENAVAAIIEHVEAPVILGEDAMRHEQLWERMYWATLPRGQTGYGAHAIAAIDVALWDIKGKRFDEPIWRLLGGARSRVRTYTTFGFEFLSREQLAAAADYWVGEGHTRLKMTVAAGALRNRDRGHSIEEVIAEDVERVRSVREAVGERAEIFLDANCSLTAPAAFQLAERVVDFGISFFEEPIVQNDVRQLADLRRRSRIPLAAGQNEGLSYRYRDLLVHEAIDVLQPNVVIGGGFTQCLRSAGLASAFNVPIDNGGGWPFHNMHLHAGVANGGMVEYHVPAVLLCNELFEGLPVPENGWLGLPAGPGLGFTPRPGAAQQFASKS